MKLNKVQKESVWVFRLVFTFVKPSAVPVVLLEVNITKSKTANRSVKKSWLTRRAEPDLIGSGTDVRVCVCVCSTACMVGWRAILKDLHEL